MPQCHCCHKNEGTVRKWDTIPVGTQQGNVPKRVPVETLCDPCNDGQYPYYERTPDGGEVQRCPHNV
jgi:hypothetical protein